MPSIGGGGGGGGFHGGGFSGGGGGGFHGGGYYGGGYYRRGGIFSSIIGAVLSPLIFAIVGIALIVVFFVTINSKSVKYDEDAFQKYAFERYAEFYGSGEDAITFVFLASEDPESDGYYQISVVGDNIVYDVNSLFGGDTTVFGKYLDDALPANYKNSMTPALSNAVEKTGDYIEARGTDGVFRTPPSATAAPRLVNTAAFLNVNKDIVEASLAEFRTETGISMSIYIASVDDVFKRSSASWLFLVVGLICLGISFFLVFMAVKAIKAIKARREARNGGSGTPSGSGGRGRDDDPYGGSFTDRYSE